MTGSKLVGSTHPDAIKEDERRASILDYVHRSFRDPADQDYIAARVLYRLGLLSQFLWAAEQAIEKYLKAILLYNDTSAKGLGHDLEKALNRLGEINDIAFRIPEDVRKFIAHLNEEGSNRYFEYPVRVLGDELLQLDKAVWHLRRYAQWLRGTVELKNGPVDRLPFELDDLHSFEPADAHRFRLSGGYLEQVLKKASAAREHLVWKNFYYGDRRKRYIKFAKVGLLANPAHYLRPEIFEELSSRVDFSKAVKDAFKAGIKRGGGSP